MITAIISKAFVYNGEVWLIGWLVCALLYFAILISFRRNRTRKGFKNLLFCFLLTEFLVDLAWSLIYYDGSGYVNRGIAALYGLILWPVALAAGGILATRLNKQVD